MAPARSPKAPCGLKGLTTAPPGPRRCHLPAGRRSRRNPARRPPKPLRKSGPGATLRCGLHASTLTPSPASSPAAGRPRSASGRPRPAARRRSGAAPSRPSRRRPARPTPSGPSAARQGPCTRAGRARCAAGPAPPAGRTRNGASRSHDPWRNRRRAGSSLIRAARKGARTPQASSMLLPAARACRVACRLHRARRQAAPA
mmetsp:Transcript_49270/g.141681  ORF Transcript_49270/g.141681 Transcript_49270/m.141681 type:complete len:201 (+) Transcript_49270:1549-2151(+)